MEVWLDTCDVDYIRNISALGILEGVTTNPTILRGQDRGQIIPALLDTKTGIVAVQVASGSAEEMFQQALALASMSDRILVKIPTHSEGLKCMHLLRQKNIPFLATAIFTSLQALLAFKADATYLAPYVGRIHDGGANPWETLDAIQDLKKQYGFKGKVLAASLRDLSAVEICAKKGLDAVTLRPALFDEWLTTPAGLALALQEWS